MQSSRCYQNLNVYVFWVLNPGPRKLLSDVHRVIKKNGLPSVFSLTVANTVGGRAVWLRLRNVCSIHNA